MEVFLIPVGGRRYELYCEVADDDDDAEIDRPKGPRAGFFRGLLLKFQARLKQAERDLNYGVTRAEGPTWRHKLSDRVIGWMAEKIAEQRLLWHLRRHAEAAVAYPADMPESDAVATLKDLLKRDGDRHMRWMILHAVAFVVASVLLGPLFLLVPGIANIPAGYFAFRMVGHYLSMRGARQGFAQVQWQAIPSEPLRELRRAISLEPAQRERRVIDIALELRLERLPTFFERAVAPGA